VTGIVKDASGNVGIGTASPKMKLNAEGTYGNPVTSGSTPTGIARFSQTTNNVTLDIGVTTGNKVWLQGADKGDLSYTYDLLLNPTSGNVGIGTASPARILDIAAANPGGGGGLRVTASTGTNGSNMQVSNTGGNFYHAIDTSAGGTFGSAYSANIWYDGNYPMRFATNNSEQMRIDSSGNLLVGSTSALGSEQVYFLSGSASKDVLVVNNSVSSGTGERLIRGRANGSDRFYVLTNGNVQNTNNSYGAISDIKLKENVVDATPKLEKLNQVRIVNYNLIGDEQKQLGVIAQEVEQLFPSMIDESPDRDAEGNDLGTTTKSVKYSVFVPMLIKAIQEQQALITQLQADVATLKAMSA
jgi:hypothetical protein